jgi:hypothetical protein
MKKLFLILVAAITIFLGSSFKPNAMSQQTLSSATPQQEQCYRVKVTYDIIYELRTERWGGSVIQSKTVKSGETYITPQCADSESEARDQAVSECYNACNNGEGKYVKEASNGNGFIFEVRRVTRTDIIGTCGNC